MSPLNVLCAQLTRDLFAITKFLLLLLLSSSIGNGSLLIDALHFIKRTDSSSAWADRSLFLQLALMNMCLLKVRALLAFLAYVDRSLVVIKCKQYVETSQDKQNLKPPTKKRRNQTAAC